MPTRSLKRRGAPAASTGAAVPSVASTRGPVAVTPSSASARAAPLPVSSSPPGLGLGRSAPSEIANMSRASVIDAAGGLLSLGGGGSAPEADAHDLEAPSAVHVSIITRGDDNEQGGDAGEEASGTAVAKTRKRKRIKTCKLPGCDKYARVGMEGYCQAHHTELVLGVEKRPRKPVPQGRICSVSGCSKRIQQGGVCCRHGAKTTRAVCSADGCNNASKRGGLCRRHGAFDLNTCDTKGCHRVAVHGIFCSVHTETCASAGCRAGATSGYYCQRHCVKPPPRKTVACTPKKRTKSANEARINAAISAVQTRYGTGVNTLSSLTVRGVTQRATGKWQAQLYHAGKSRYIGTFPSRTQAILAYEVARELLGQESSVGVTEKSLAEARKAAFKAVSLA